jgi:uncharacterized protein (TIGR03437 family)
MSSLSRSLNLTNRICISLFLTALIFLAPLPVVPVRVQAQSASDTPATMPSPEVAFLVGPQVRSGTSSLPAAGWFDQTASSRGLTLCSEFPDVANTPGNVLISGTVSVTNGSKTVTGTGTRFLTEAKNYAIISNGSAGRVVKIIASVQSDTSLTLTIPWQGSTLSGQSMSSPTGTDVDTYQGYLNYYDFAFVQYTNYYRTGDQRFLDCARKVADSWWSQPIIDYGRNVISVSGDGLAPRSIALTGLILRALDGRPEMWPWITDYVNYQYHNWVEVPTTWSGLYFGVRDGGFMLLYAADLGAVHPDPATRSSFRSRALAGAVNYYARLQGTDGSYRWNVDDSAPGSLDGFTGMQQPFMIGILNEGMIAVHRLTGDSVVKNAITKSVEHEYLRSYNPNGWRAMYYFIHGNFNTGVSCESGCGNAANPFPPSDPGQIIEARQLNATAISQFGYAYSITGDSRYRQWGDEIFDSTYGGGDGYRGLAAYRGKEYDESYRSGGKYLAWRTGGSFPTPSPTPTPSGTPTPSPTATPTPTPAPSPTPSPTPTGPTVDTVWINGSLPAGAVATSDLDGWTWSSSNPVPFSAPMTHQSPVLTGQHQHYFTQATATITPAVGERLFAYVYIDPTNKPSEIMLQWNSAGWEHRAYWGSNFVAMGADGTVSRRSMGALPPTGQWVRLEVAASDVGLEGRTINGMAFTLYGGAASWDRAGKSSQAATPTPTPTPTPNPITVQLTSPASNTTYSLGTSPTLSASASNSKGVISRVAFNANTQVLGTFTATPYTMTWNNPAAGTYTVTATASDDKAGTATSSPITVKISKTLKGVRNGKSSASSLQTSITASNTSSLSGEAVKSSDIDSLVDILNEAYLDFATERSMFAPASDIDRYFFAALFLAKSSSGLTKQQQAAVSGVVDRLSKIDVYLSFIEDLMVDGVISNQSLAAASKANARVDVSINHPDVLPLGNNGTNLLQNGTAALSCSISNPMTSVTDVAPPSGAYELGGVTVTVGGTAASLISISPTAIAFRVPVDLPAGIADVIVTSRDGYIVHTTASVGGLNPTIFIQQGDANLTGAIVNSFAFSQGTFSPFSLGWFGDGGNTRLTILASGISTGLTNSNLSNDVSLSNGTVIENYAEAVAVEARLGDGRVISLPVEFAGSTGTMRGMDQVTIRLTPDLAGAGSVQITVIAGGRRSNTTRILIN